MNSRCLAFTAINTVQLTQTNLRAPRAGEALVETEISGVSPGTELRCLTGREPGLGANPFPFIPGYSLVGRVVEAPGNEASLVGRRVLSEGCRDGASLKTAWGGHMGHALVSASSLFVLPEEVSSQDAVLLKLAAIAFRGVRLSREVVGKTVAVVGLGPIGQISARLFHMAGASVVGFDVAADRVSVLASVGVEAQVIEGGMVPSVKRVFPAGAQIVVDCTGVPALLRETTQLVIDKPWSDDPLPGGTLVVQGSYGTDVSLAPGDCFQRELTILWPRDNQRADLQVVANAVASGRLNLAGLIGGVFSPEEAPEVYAKLLNRTSNLLTAAFDWKR
ncbi:MAG: zinc-binding alcohol dehydrogenase [Opitutaceae bacterium]|nr:zinc-binding alcohol dehydrogenase [Opitutaceae bacterium]